MPGDVGFLFFCPLQPIFECFLWLLFPCNFLPHTYKLKGKISFIACNSTVLDEIPLVQHPIYSCQLR